MSLDKYLLAKMKNLQQGVRSAYFCGMVAALDELYEAAGVIEPVTGDEVVYCKFLKICYKSMLSAACIIAEGQPEDSFAITRRAIECAQTALADKIEPGSVQTWLAQKDRTARWDARDAGERPKRLSIEFTKAVKDNALYQELNTFLGVQSDMYVHFTPEFYSQLAWVDVPSSGGICRIGLDFFRQEGQEVERGFSFMASTHDLILKTFDFCFDGRLSTDPDYKKRLDTYRTIAKILIDAYRDKYSIGKAVSTE